MVDLTSLDETLQKIDYIFRWTGMNLESSRKTPAENRKYKYLFIFTSLWLHSETVGAIAWFLDGASKGESLTSLTYAAPCITLTIMSLIKSTTFLIHEKQVNDLIALLRNLETKRIDLLKKEDDTSALIKKDIKFLNLILKAQIYGSWFLTVSFSGMAFIPTILGYIETKKIELFLPLLIKYPFDPFNPKIWPFIYARQVYGTILVVLEICGADCFLYICSVYIHIQFKILKHELHNLIPHRNVSFGFQEDSEEINKKLAELIDSHRQLIRCVKLLEVIFSKCTLYNFVSSSALICLTGFNVTTIDDVPFVVSFLSFLFMSLMQIFFICYFGDIILTSSVDVSNGIYNSNWYLVEAKISKKLLFAIIRSQRPCKLTAYGFAEVNLRAFTKILSTAWSYFALLKTVYSSPK